MGEKPFVKLKTYGKGESASLVYLELRDHPGKGTFGCIAHTVQLNYVLEKFNGPHIAFDLDAQNRAIGIEIIYPSDDDDDEDELEYIADED